MLLLLLFLFLFLLLPLRLPLLLLLLHLPFSAAAVTAAATVDRCCCQFLQDAVLVRHCQQPGKVSYALEGTLQARALRLRMSRQGGEHGAGRESGAHPGSTGPRLGRMHDLISRLLGRATG